MRPDAGLLEQITSVCNYCNRKINLTLLLLANCQMQCNHMCSFIMTNTTCFAFHLFPIDFTSFVGWVLNVVMNVFCIVLSTLIMEKYLNSIKSMLNHKRISQVTLISSQRNERFIRPFLNEVEQKSKTTNNVKWSRKYYMIEMLGNSL